MELTFEDLAMLQDLLNDPTPPPPPLVPLTPEAQQTKRSQRVLHWRMKRQIQTYYDLLSGPYTKLDLTMQSVGLVKKENLNYLGANIFY